MMTRAKLASQLLTIAQRFNAGLQIKTMSKFREGRKNATVAAEWFEYRCVSFVPPGLTALRAADPALKRWASIG
jgi:hypothetical protein